MTATPNDKNSQAALLLPSLRECFLANRYLLLALVSNERARAGAAKAYPSGTAVLLRCVYPQVRVDAQTATQCDASACLDLDCISARSIDPLATLAAPHPLHRELFNWAPMPAACEAFAQAGTPQQQQAAAQALDRSSIVHLAFAPGTPHEPLYVLSANEQGASVTHRYQNSQWSSCELDYGLRSEFEEALEMAHLRACTENGTPTVGAPSEHDISDMHDALRVQALAQRQAAVSACLISERDVFVPRIRLASITDAAQHIDVLTPIPSIVATTQSEIEQQFDSLLVRVALRERASYPRPSGFGELEEDDAS